jgi:hypothetical protein
MIINAVEAYNILLAVNKTHTRMFPQVHEENFGRGTAVPVFTTHFTPNFPQAKLALLCPCMPRTGYQDKCVLNLTDYTDGRRAITWCQLVR